MICHAAKGNTSNESNVQAVRQCPVHRSPPATVWRRVRHSREWEHRRVLIWDSRHVVTDRPYPANPALTKTIGAAAPWNTSFNCHQRTQPTNITNTSIDSCSVLREMKYKLIFFCSLLAAVLLIIPSQMEVAPLHCTVDIRQKRRLFKNTKEIEKM